MSYSHFKKCLRMVQVSLKAFKKCLKKQAILNFTSLCLHPGNQNQSKVLGNLVSDERC